VIDGGIILMLMGAIVSVVASAQDAIAYRRWQATGGDADPAIDPRIVAADAALARDPFIAGVAGIAEIYRGA
jgi:hypothetical protein